MQKQGTVWCTRHQRRRSKEALGGAEHFNRKSLKVPHNPLFCDIHVGFKYILKKKITIVMVHNPFSTDLNQPNKKKYLSNIDFDKYIIKISTFKD